MLMWHDLRAGSFGVVHAAIDKQTGERVAVKTMVKRYGGDGLLESNFVRRVQHEVSTTHGTQCMFAQSWCACTFF